MHSAIVTVELTPETDAGKQTWLAFSATIAKLQGNPAAQQLGPNVWQVDFQQSPAALAWLVVACEQHQLPYQILPLDSEPGWIRGGVPTSSGVRNAGSWQGHQED
jgi:hypothetical protein